MREIPDPPAPLRGTVHRARRLGGAAEEEMMRSIRIAVAMLAMAGAALLAFGAAAGGKLPKCSGQLCHSTCSPDILCARGAKVVTCAEYCSGN